VLFYFLLWKDCRCRVPPSNGSNFVFYNAVSHDNNSVFFMGKNSHYGFLSSEDLVTVPSERSFLFLHYFITPTRVLACLDMCLAASTLVLMYSVCTLYLALLVS
jgi:hypothetical protein